MKARFLVMVAALLLAIVLAWGGTAWADQGSAPVDPSVLTELDAAGGGTVPVIVYATPGHLADLTAEIDPATMDDSLSLIGAVSADVTSNTPRRRRRAAVRRLHRRRRPHLRHRLCGQPRRDQRGHRAGQHHAADQRAALTAPASASRSSTAAAADVRDLDGANGRSRVVAFVDFVNRRRQLYDNGGHGTFVDGLIAGNGTNSLPVDQGGKATTQYRGVAPGRQHRLTQGPRQPRPGTRVVADRGHRVGDLPPPPVQHPRDEHLGRGRRDLAGRLRPAGSRRRRRLAGRHRGRLRRGQRRRLRPGRHPVAGQRPLRHHRRRLRHPADRRHRATTRCAPTARSARPSTTSSPSPTWSRPGTTSSRCARPEAGSTSPIRRRAWPSRPTSPARRAGCPAAYAVMSGTSASAPVVSGAAALLIQQDPSLTPGRRQAASHGQRRPAAGREHATPRVPAS